MKLILWVTLIGFNGSGQVIDKNARQNCQSVEVLNTRAKKFLFILPDSAFQLANLALQVSGTNECVLKKSESHQIIGIVLFHQGVYQESIRHLLQAYSSFDESKEKEKSAETLNQLGLVYFNIKQPDLAQQQHQKALKLYEELKDEKGIAYSYGCIGHLYEKREEFAQALAYQQKALNYYQKDNDKQGIATIIENIGSIYEDQENYVLALDYFTQSLKLTQLIGDSLLMIVNINNIGDNYRKTQQYEKAIEWTEKAVELADRLKDKYQLSSAYKDLSKIYGLTEVTQIQKLSNAKFAVSQSGFLAVSISNDVANFQFIDNKGSRIYFTEIRK